MTKTIRFGVAGIAMAAAMGMSSTAYAQSNSDTATAEAEILQALELERLSGSLDFGSVVITATGSITLSPTGGRTCNAAVATCVDTPANPLFEIRGTTGRDVTITLPASAVTLTHSDVSVTDTLTVSNFSSSEGTSVTLDSAGEEQFTVGGQLNFTAGQAAGVYSGQFTVEVDYS